MQAIKFEIGGFYDHLDAPDVNNILAFITNSIINKMIKTKDGGKVWYGIVVLQDK